MDIRATGEKYNKNKSHFIPILVSINFKTAVKIYAPSRNGLKEPVYLPALKKLENQIKYLKQWFSVVGQWQHSTVIPEKRTNGSLRLPQLPACILQGGAQREDTQTGPSNLRCKDLSLGRTKWLAFEEKKKATQKESSRALCMNVRKLPQDQEKNRVGSICMPMSHSGKTS